MTLILLVILVALVFEYINGFHDTANSIATVVGTKVLTPRQAVVLAASTNLIGALVGTAVARTIASGLVEPRMVTSQVLVCALLDLGLDRVTGSPAVAGEPDGPLNLFSIPAFHWL